jgi:hypothetical protein
MSFNNFMFDYNMYDTWTLQQINCQFLFAQITYIKDAWKGNNTWMHTWTFTFHPSHILLISYIWTPRPHIASHWKAHYFMTFVDYYIYQMWVFSWSTYTKQVII